MKNNLTNKIYGIWYVEKLHKDNGGADRSEWECVCPNGHHCIMIGRNLKRKKHCDKCKEIELQRKKEEKQKISEEYWTNKYNKLIGKIFGELTVLELDGYDKRNQLMWKCRCSCGETVLVSSHYLISGKKDNCGCRTKEKQREARKKYNKYDLTGEFGIGYTNKGEEFYFDLEDYELIKDYCWSYHYGYLVARGEKRGESIRQHRLIMGLKKGDNLFIDHINHNTHDNRKSNLRLCTNQENCMNQNTSKRNTSGKSGISWRKDNNKWRVRIYKNYKCYTIGQFDTYEEAYKARIEAEDKYFGGFANLEERCGDIND